MSDHDQGMEQAHLASIRARMDVTQTVDDDDDLVEELSAFDQAMVSEETDQEGTFLTGGNTRDFLELKDETLLDEHRMLNPAPVRDGQPLLDYLRKSLHKFDSPYAYIGGEANSPSQDRYATAEVKILIARLSSYEAVSLSMTHSLMSQIYTELDYTFTDLAFMPKPNDYDVLKSNAFPVWFGTNTKLAPNKFDVLSISHAVSMEQLNFVPLLHDSGIPIFKQQRMEREDIPIIIVGGANGGTTAPLNGEWTTADGKVYSGFIDAVIYGDGEEAAKEFIGVVREGKQKGWTKLQILAACHGRVEGFYEPDKYTHTYDGSGTLISIAPVDPKYEFPVRRATVLDLDTVRTLESKILPFTGDGASVDVAIAGSVGCIGSAGWGACSFCREGSEGPYRERSVDKVMAALDTATRNQGTKEVSFFSLNFNMYTDLFPLVERSVKKGYKIGLISQRIDMLAETPEQVHVQRWLKKSNFTLGVEGISNRIRAFLNKNVQEWEVLKVCREMMLGGAGELKFFYILCLPAGERVWTNRGMIQIQEFCSDVVFPPLEGERVEGLPSEVASVVVQDGVEVWAGSKRPATKWVTKSETQIVKVVNDLGQSVRMAYDHWVKTETGWKKAGELTVDDSTEVAIGGVFGDSDELSLVQARVLGQAAGDGGSNGVGRGFYCAFNYNDQDEINYLRANGEDSGWLTSRNSKQMYFAEADAKVWARELDGTAWTKKVPEIIYRSPVDIVAGWVEGYFQADGALDSNGYPRWCSRSEQLLRGTQELLLALGVVSRLKQYHTTNGSQWHLTIRGASIAKFKAVVASCPKASRIKEGGYNTATRNKFSQVVSVTLDGVEPVYSPMVEDADETYYASGMVHHNTNMETEVDILEHAAFMEKVNALREKLGAKTRFRLSFTPLFPSAFTALQFSPCLAAMKHGEKNLTPVFEKARDLGWGRRLSVSGEEPLISNTINHGGRNITPLLLLSHFADGFRFYGNVPKGTWIRWQNRLPQFPNVDLEKTWGEKDFDYVFPWEDIAYSTSKDVMYRGYLKAVTYQGIPYCITTPTIQGECHVNECGACDPKKTGKPDPKIIKMIVGRKVAPPMSVKEIERVARSREKAYHLRVLAEVREPLYRFVEKNYFMHTIARAFMRTSDKFTDAFVGSIGHARIGSGANGMRDWVYGQNIYDYSLCEMLSETELRELLPQANEQFGEGNILSVRMDTHLTSLRNDVDFAVYTMFIPAATYSYKDLRDDVAKYFERKGMGKTNVIKVKKAFGKDIFKTVEVSLAKQDIRQVDLTFRPDLRGCIVRMVVSARYNMLAMLETITGRKAFRWKGVPIYCDGYIALPENLGEVDVFQALSGGVSHCSSCGGPLERELFTGNHHSEICLSCDIDQYPLDTDIFFTKLLTAV